jgi:hypothetical protein
VRTILRWQHADFESGAHWRPCFTFASGGPARTGGPADSDGPGARGGAARTGLEASDSVTRNPLAGQLPPPQSADDAWVGCQARAGMRSRPRAAHLSLRADDAHARGRARASAAIVIRLFLPPAAVRLSGRPRHVTARAHSLTHPNRFGLSHGPQGPGPRRLRQLGGPRAGALEYWLRLGRSVKPNLRLSLGAWGLLRAASRRWAARRPRPAWAEGTPATPRLRSRSRLVKSTLSRELAESGRIYC